MTILPFRPGLVVMTALCATLFVACAPKPAAPEPVRAVRTLKLGQADARPQVDYADRKSTRLNSSH